MRWIGLLGLAILLGIGVLFSKNRPRIRLRVVTWGVALQVLFAVIILSQNALSWVGMYVFLVLVLLYVFTDTALTPGQWGKAAGPATVIAAGGAAVVAIGYFLDRLQAAVPLVVVTVLAAIVLHACKRPQFARYSSGAVLTLGLGVLISRGIYGQSVMQVLADQVAKFLKLSDLGATFLFGNLAKAEFFDQFGVQFAFSVLPTIIFFSAVIAILYYLGVMQAVVVMMARFMRWTMGTSGAETLSCSANIFVGQTEAPLLIRPFLDRLTISELHAVMVGGFATIAGGVMAGYIRMGINPAYLITASVMSTPAALVMAKIFLPETERSVTAGDVRLPPIPRGENLLDAAARGVTDGLKLAANVGAMLIAFIALIGLVDVVLAFGDKFIDGRLLGGVYNAQRQEFRGIFPGSLRVLFGAIFSPLAFVMGVPWKEAAAVGNLLGIKVAANEFVAYVELSKHVAAADLSPRATLIATYALCGFANFSSIGIQIGGIGALAPNRRPELAKVGLRAMIAGALASWMTATIAGLLS
ncbi:MAG: nucleoside transporter C-terminal domain-containing protein [bacterium]|jgi:CNT family concentrative nucleoside transporter|nr:NupC/NupG family nucleoside CNT transporter [candidate division KSB1 bacterium]MDH7561607.1 nucleoside transporter C-terminal domain-containing protein [bacterium]